MDTLEPIFHRQQALSTLAAFGFLPHDPEMLLIGCADARPDSIADIELAAHAPYNAFELEKA